MSEHYNHNHSYDTDGHYGLPPIHHPHDFSVAHAGQGIDDVIDDHAMALASMQQIHPGHDDQMHRHDDNNLNHHAQSTAAAPARKEYDEHDIKTQLRLLDELRYREELNAEQVQDLNRLHTKWSKKAELRDFAPKDNHNRPTPISKSRFDKKWYNKLEELKAYCVKNETCHVPQIQTDKDHDPNRLSLAKWCDHQRQLYNRRSEGAKTSLTDERVASLESLGFEWRLRNLKGSSKHQGNTAEANGSHLPVDQTNSLLANVFSNPREQDPGELNCDYNWDVRFQELKRYQKAFATTSVLKQNHSAYNKHLIALSLWSAQQSAEYQNKIRGEKCSLSQSRLKSLESIEFLFVGNKMTFTADDAVSEGALQESTCPVVEGSHAGAEAGMVQMHSLGHEMGVPHG